jgi:hypothetical protein
VTLPELKNRFAYHKPSNEQVAARHALVRNNCLDLAQKIIDLTPPGSEQDDAIKKPEEVMFWANAAIARNQ